MVTDLVTREAHQELSFSDGRIQTEDAEDLITVAAIDRHFTPGKRFCGLLKGFGLTSGAVASSAAWDTSDIIVAGADAGDMATAVNRIHQLQGGTVVCEHGRILCELAMPVFGLITPEPVETVVDAVNEINGHLARLGMSFPDPVLSLVTLTGAAIPYLRICEEGLVNLKEGTAMPLVVG
jgi:adenine deaminase